MTADRFHVIARNLNPLWPHDDSWLAGMASTVWASACQNVEDIFKVISASERDDRALAVAEGILNERLEVKAVDAARVTCLCVLENDERHAAPTSRDSVTKFYHRTVKRVCFAASGYSGGE